MPDQKLGIAVGADVLEKGPGDLAEVDVWACQHGAGVRERKGDQPWAGQREANRNRGDSGQELTVGVAERQNERLEAVTVGQQSGPLGEVERRGFRVRRGEFAPSGVF